jgi:hypothetical protein
VTGHRRIDKKRNTDVKQDLKVYFIRDKIKEYQLKYFLHIFRVPTYRILGRCFSATLAKKERLTTKLVER